jgi:hypothetical protein
MHGFGCGGWPRRDSRARPGPCVRIGRVRRRGYEGTNEYVFSVQALPGFAGLRQTRDADWEPRPVGWSFDLPTADFDREPHGICHRLRPDGRLAILCVSVPRHSSGGTPATGIRPPTEGLPGIARVATTAACQTTTRPPIGPGVNPPAAASTRRARRFVIVIRAESADHEPRPFAAGGSGS